MQKKRMLGIAAAIVLAPAMVFSGGRKEAAAKETPATAA
jgi:hypothetical protein